MLKSQNEELQDSSKHFDDIRTKNVNLTSELENLKRVNKNTQTEMKKIKKEYDDLLRKQQTMFAGDANVFDMVLQQGRTVPRLPPTAAALQDEEEEEGYAEEEAVAATATAAVEPPPRYVRKYGGKKPSTSHVPDW